jgi:hypothetical protein
MAAENTALHLGHNASPACIWSDRWTVIGGRHTASRKALLHSPLSCGTGRNLGGCQARVAPSFFKLEPILTGRRCLRSARPALAGKRGLGSAPPPTRRLRSSGPPSATLRRVGGRSRPARPGWRGRLRWSRRAARCPHGRPRSGLRLPRHGSGPAEAQLVARLKVLRGLRVEHRLEGDDDLVDADRGVAGIGRGGAPYAGTPFDRLSLRCRSDR